MQQVGKVLEAFCALALWAQVQAAAEVHTQVEFAAPVGAGGGVRGVINLIFRVAGGWEIVDYQSELVAAAVERGRCPAQEQLAGEVVVERRVWHIEIGVRQQL